MTQTTIEGIYKQGMIEPCGNIKLKNNTKVKIIVEKCSCKSLEGMGKQLVNDKELESFLEKTKKSLTK